MFDLEKYGLSDFSDVALDASAYEFLAEEAEKLNERLVQEEAGSWETASKLVLTD